MPEGARATLARMNPFSNLTEALPFLAALPPALVFVLILALALWTTVIKAFALWHAARSGQLAWFIALLVVNSLGILELVYLLAFRKDTRPGAPLVASSAPDA